MTLQDILDMTAEQFSTACETARPDYTKYESINDHSETLTQALDGYAKFQQTQESINAVYSAGEKIP